MFYLFYSIGDVTVPMLILHAKDDGIVPYELGVKVLNENKLVISFIN